MRRQGRKLDSPLKYRHLAKITLRPFSQFPIDMLRYDNAHPHEEVDSSAIEASLQTIGSVKFGNPRSFIILVEQYAETSMPHWTEARWRSFGCAFESIDASEVPALRKQIEEAEALSVQATAGSDWHEASQRGAKP